MWRWKNLMVKISMMHVTSIILSHYLPSLLNSSIAIKTSAIKFLSVIRQWWGVLDKSTMAENMRCRCTATGVSTTEDAAAFLGIWTRFCHWDYLCLPDNPLMMKVMVLSSSLWQSTILYPYSYITSTQNSYSSTSTYHYLWILSSKVQIQVLYLSYFLLASEKDTCMTPCSSLPRWLSGLRHSAHRPERSAGGAGVQSPVGR